MTILQLILLSIFVVILFDCFFRKQDIFSPARVFMLVWSMSIFFAEFKFSGYQYHWSSFSWFILILGLISFLLGCFISYSLVLDKTIKSLTEIRTKIQEETNPEKLFYISLILFFIYISAFVAEVILEGYIPLFSQRVDRARVEFGVFGIHLLVSLQMALSIINFEYIIISKDKRKKIIIWVIFIVSFITFSTLLQRFSFFLSALIIFSIIYYASFKITKKKIIFAVVLFISLLSLIQSIRIANYIQNFIYQVSKMRYHERYAAFTEPYMYVTMNLENMAHGVDLLEKHTFGLMSFDWLAALSGIKHWSQEYFNIIPRPFLNSGYNTFPFLWDYYYDFGMAGVLILPMLIGFIISMLYYNMKISPNLRSIVYYSIGFSITFISFFTNPLSLLGFVANIFVIFLIHKLMFNNEKSLKQNHGKY